MFKEATRLKLRFNTEAGNLSVEDVWDLPLTSEKKSSLDKLAKALNKELKNSEEKSFVETPSKANATLQLKFSVVKEIIKVRLDEREARKAAADRKDRKELLNGIILKKENAELETSSLEDLKKMRDSL